MSIFSLWLIWQRPSTRTPDQYSLLSSSLPSIETSWRTVAVRTFFCWQSSSEIFLLTNRLSTKKFLERYSSAGRLRLEMEILKEIYQFHTFYLKIVSPCDWRVTIFTYRCYIPNLVKTRSVVHEMKTLPDDAKKRRWSPADRNIGHLCNSNDPKIIKLTLA